MTATAVTASPDLTVPLPVAAPATLTGAIAHLRTRAVPGLEVAGDRGLRRSVVLGDVPVVVEVVADVAGGGCTLRAWEAGDTRAAATGEVGPWAAAAVAWGRRLLGLEVDPTSADAVLGADPALAGLVAARPGLRLAGSPGGFETVVRTVLGQQVTVAAGVALVARVVDRLGTPLGQPVGGVTRLFPTPDRVATADLTFLPMPGARQATLRTVAAAAVEGRLTLAPGTDPALVHEQLLALRGVGPWTAAYVALRGFADPDAFPAGDVAVLRAARERGLPSDARTLAAHAERWRPWRAHAAQHLWDSLVPG